MSSVMIIIIMLAIIAVSLFFRVSINKKKLAKKTIIVPLKTVSINVEYKNPFDKKSQYQNPFDDYQNPMDELVFAQTQ